MQDKTLHGAIAIIKVGGIAVGKMKDVRVNESFRRIRVSKGLGSIMPDEFALTEWAGQLTCSFFEINYKKSGIPQALNRIFGSNILSQVALQNPGLPNFEDQLVLDYLGVDIELYKKVQGTPQQVVQGQIITPDLESYATIRGCFIESDNVNISEGQVSGRDQSFQYLYPVIMTK